MTLGSGCNEIMCHINTVLCGIKVNSYSIELSAHCRYPLTGLQDGQKVTKGFVPQRVAIQATPSMLIMVVFLLPHFVLNIPYLCPFTYYSLCKQLICVKSIIIVDIIHYQFRSQIKHLR